MALVVAVALATAAMVGAFAMGGLALLGIQDERATSVRRSCEETNERHARGLREVDRLTLERLTGRLIPRSTPAETVRERLRVAVAELSEPQVRELRAGRRVTVVLIQALVPRQDCDARVAAAVGGR